MPLVCTAQPPLRATYLSSELGCSGGRLSTSSLAAGACVATSSSTALTPTNTPRAAISTGCSVTSRNRSAGIQVQVELLAGSHSTGSKVLHLHLPGRACTSAQCRWCQSALRLPERLAADLGLRHFSGATADCLPYRLHSPRNACVRLASHLVTGAGVPNLLGAGI